MIDQVRHSAEYRFSLRVLSFYARIVPPYAEPLVEPDLVGKLLYAGALDDNCRALVAAANVAGAATLCATADEQAQKQAIRDGIADFLVTTLDEALRILKNEIRKRATVAVCIGAPPTEIEAQMFERGVDPDVLRPDDAAAGDEANTCPVPADAALVSWSVSSAAARWMPKLDAFALQCASELPEAARRWLRMSPRYLGRLAQSTHLALAGRTFATRFMEGAMTLENASIPLKLQVSYRGGCEEFNSPNWNKEESIS
jgi:Urocanase Rossmann-like domain